MCSEEGGLEPSARLDHGLLLAPRMRQPPQPLTSGTDADSHEPGRRHFCAALVVLGAGACSGPVNQIEVAGLDGFGSSQGPSPSDDLAGTPSSGDDLAHAGAEDLAHASKADMASGTTKQDMASSSGGSCSGNVSGGASSAVTEGSPVYVSSGKVYVCRDSGGLYALSSKCTHQGCKLSVETTKFYCNCHGATFDLNGQNPTSPAFKALDHYELCVTSAGTVEINTASIVDPSTRA